MVPKFGNGLRELKLGMLTKFMIEMRNMTRFSHSEIPFHLIFWGELNLNLEQFGPLWSEYLHNVRRVIKVGMQTEFVIEMRNMINFTCSKSLST